jgi:hypothetical protein
VRRYLLLVANRKRGTLVLESLCNSYTGRAEQCAKKENNTTAIPNHSRLFDQQSLKLILHPAEYPSTEGPIPVHLLIGFIE